MFKKLLFTFIVGLALLIGSNSFAQSAGSNGQIQYKNGTGFGASSHLSYNSGTAVFTINGTLSATTISGNGSGLMITAQSTTVPYSLAALFGKPIDVRQMGAICDGSPHSGNLTAGQNALNLAKGNNYGVEIVFPDNCVWGTNTTLNTESPLQYASNTIITITGRNYHNINNGELFLFEGINNSDTDTPSQTNVVIRGLPGGRLDTITRTTGQSRKFIGLTNVKNGRIEDIFISTTATIGSFAVQARNCEACVIQNNVVWLAPGGVGEDGIHTTGDISGVLVIGNDVRSNDDAFSTTEENSSMANKLTRNVRVEGNKLYTYAFSGIKVFAGNSASGAKIIGTQYVNNQLGVWGPHGLDGNCVVIQEEDGSFIKDLVWRGNTCDDSNGEAYPGSPAVLITAEDYGGVDNVDLGDLTVKNYPYQGIIIESNVINTKSNGMKYLNYTGQTNVLTGLVTASLRRTSANTLSAFITSGTDLSGIDAANDYASIVSTTFTSNTGVFNIASVNDASDTINLTSTGVAATTDEAGTNPSITIIFRAGNAIQIKGSDNGSFLNTFISNPPTTAISLVLDSTKKPLRNQFINTRIVSQTQDNGFSVSAGWNTYIANTLCSDFQGDRCITESSSANVSQSTFVYNTDTGPNFARQSWSFSDADYLNKFMNIGTNSDYFTSVNDLITISSSGINAVSATITTSLTVGNVSITSGLLKTLNVSATGNVSVTGNSSAAFFVGDGSLLTNIVASAIPGGNSGQLQFNNGGATSGTTAVTYNSATNILLTGGISGSTISATNIGSNGASDLFMTWDTNDTLTYNKTSNRWEWKVGGTERYRQSAATFNLSGVNMAIGSSIFSPSNELEVRGTISVTNVIASATTGTISGTFINGNVASLTTLTAGSISSTGVSKAWVNLNGNATCAVTEGLNVASCSRISAGYYGVSFTTAMNSANYTVTCTPIGGSTINDSTMLDDAISPTTTGFAVRNINLTGLVATDNGRISCDIHGR